MKKLLSIIVILLVLTGTGAWAYSKLHIVPCSKPIKYSIGEFDPDFNITQNQFLLDIQAAAAIWAQAGEGKQFFTFDPKANLKINLVYDTRQDNTNKLKNLGITIEDTKSSYDQLKIRYETMRSDYELAKRAFDAFVATYQKNQNDYNQQVKFWNSQGGAPKETYNQLSNQKAVLESQRVKILAEQSDLNQQVASLNVVVDALNQLGKKLNLNISTYNNIGAAQGPEFEEGVYVQDSSGRYIDIYEFDSENQLIRLIAHELGHSLGLSHVDDSDAIMYRLNSSTNQFATAGDIAELKQICKLP